MTQNTHKPYDALLRSIDFFSQNLHLEQITQYGFKLFEDLVQPTQAVLYLKDTDQYTPHYSRGTILKCLIFPTRNLILILLSSADLYLNTAAQWNGFSAHKP